MAELLNEIECAFKHIVTPSRDAMAAQILSGMMGNSNYRFDGEGLQGDVEYAVDAADKLKKYLEQTANGIIE